MVTVARSRVANGLLPAVCAVCGTDAPHRRFPGVASRRWLWILSAPLFGRLAFWNYLLFAALSSRRGGVPFCDRHRGYWSERGRVVAAGLVATVGLIVLTAVVAPPLPRLRNGLPHWLYGVIGCWALTAPAAYQIMNARAMRLVGGNRNFLILTAVSHEFVAAVEGRKFVTKPAKPARPRASAERAE
jgi:hypothetical protein